MVFSLTRGPADAADKFLALLGEGKVREAYASTAGGLRSVIPEEQFGAVMRQAGLTDYRSAFWHDRQVINNTGSVEGTVTTRGGAVIPLMISCVHEDGQWKVLGVELLRGPGATVAVPGRGRVRAALPG